MARTNSADPLDGFTGDDRIVMEAQMRFDRAMAWESSWRAKADEDERFREGDADNNYQWPDYLMTDRLKANRPSLTINKIAEFCLQIANDARQNKPGVNIRPTGGGATFTAAQTFQQVIRHIEYESGAERVYDQGIDTLLTRGAAYWRVIPEWEDDTTFNQSLRIKGIKDGKNVLLDPDCKLTTGLDAEFGFIFSDVVNDMFRLQWPDDLDALGTSPLDAVQNPWVMKDHTRVAEYYRREPIRDVLHMITDEGGNEGAVLQSQLAPEVLRAALGAMESRGQKLRKRDVIRKKVEWFKIGGNKILQRTLSPGQYIPIVRVMVKETVIDGLMDRKGHVRNLKDAQRMYNYASSGAVEHGALQTKVPWIIPADAVSGLEGYWGTANTVNHSFLPYKTRDGMGNQILTRPERIPPPVSSDLFLRAMDTAEKQMMMASGQWQEQFGQPSNAESGVAINARQRRGDNATYHFPDAQGNALVATGMILIDQIPLVYDTERVIRIKADDGDEQDIHIDPTAPNAYMERQKQDQADQKQKAEIIFNPRVGKYSVVADTGPSYLTRRQEAFNALTQLLTQRPEYAGVFGDLFFLVSDFPMADVLAARMRKAIPAHITGDAPPPEVAQLQGQIQQMQAMITELTSDGAKAELQSMQEKLTQTQGDMRNQIAEYDAVTRRLTMATEMLPMDAGELGTMIEGLVKEAIVTQQQLAAKAPAATNGAAA